jgi:GntR family transcriptional regulator
MMVGVVLYWVGTRFRSEGWIVAHIDGLSPLDRSSFVPLYYQLQETLKEKIESGEWAPGDTLPPEKRLAELYGVSRVCVRQALAILEDDREIVRIQGRGTFVAQRKLLHRPTGLTGFHAGDAPGKSVVRVLDQRVGGAERAICSALSRPTDEILRITALWSVGDQPIAIGQHFFCVADTGWLDTAGLRSGRDLTPCRVNGLETGSTSISLETTQCGQFEADLLGIPHRGTLLLTFAVVRASFGDAMRPYEVVRLGYRGDIVQLNIEASPHGLA